LGIICCVFLFFGACDAAPSVEITSVTVQNDGHVTLVGVSIHKNGVYRLQMLALASPATMVRVQ